jgi:hypothetical protein
VGQHRVIRERLPRLGRLPLDLLLVLALCLAVGSACGGEGPTRPDLVLITVDRFATDRLPCFEGETDPGDAVCALADGGTLFAWAAASGAGEAAAAASVLTGLEPRVHGVGDDGRTFLRDPQVTIAEELSQAGYTTAAFVASPRVNRSRRLDQGFLLYDDRFASPGRSRLASGSDRAALDAQVRDWFARTPSPRFVWIHLDRRSGRVQLDRLVSRLAEPLEMTATGPGIIFAGLRGESASRDTSGGAASRDSSAGTSGATLGGISNGTSAETFATIDWRSHRVPLIWRAPTQGGGTVPPVSRRLASLYDIAPTLRAAAALSNEHRSEARTPQHAPLGRDLSQLIRPPVDTAPASNATDQSALDESFFVLLEAAGDQVGLASQNHLYARQRSPLDGTGRPVPTASLEVRRARFSTIQPEDPLFQGRPRAARLRTGPWRSDVLSSDSPVPQLEFHLARRLDRPSETPTP